MDANAQEFADALVDKYIDPRKPPRSWDLKGLGSKIDDVVNPGNPVEIKERPSARAINLVAGNAVRTG